MSWIVIATICAVPALIAAAGIFGLWWEIKHAVPDPDDQRAYELDGPQ